jgi:predicted nucleotidyltransferase
MNLFFEEHQEIIKELIIQEVDFMLIGGYAVIVHGYTRTTGDVDLWIKPNNDNKTKLIRAFKNLNFENDDIFELEKMNFEDYLVFSIGDEPQKIDFITKVNLVDYEEANTRKLVAEIDGINIPIVHLNDLVLMKTNTKRKKDEADIEELQKIANRKL